MKSTVNVLHWNAQSGALETVQEVPLLPEGYSGETGAADIVLDKAGRFAYAANRLDDFLASFTVSPTDGKLTLLERTSCGGKIPRHLALDKTGRWLLVANQKSDNLAVFARDAHMGRLAKAGGSSPLSRPQCLVFV
jgi:6-phosphogluconolactonase